MPFGQGFSKEHGKGVLRPAMSWDPDLKVWIHQFADFQPAQRRHAQGGRAQRRRARAQRRRGHVWAIALDRPILV